MTKSQDVNTAVVALSRMNMVQLRARYQDVFGELTRSGNREFLTKRIAWRMQSLAEGTLSERARRRAEELARDVDIRTTLPRPPKQSEGQTITLAILTRQYRGRQVEVKVLPQGFEYEGQSYRSLSAVAKQVTGSHWNGLLFFGLTTSKRNQP